jgi:hypothetical protein
MAFVGGPGIALVGGCGSVFVIPFVAGGTVPGRCGVLGGTWARRLIVAPATITRVAINNSLLMFIQPLEQQECPGGTRTIPLAALDIMPLLAKGFVPRTAGADIPVFRVQKTAASPWVQAECSFGPTVISASSTRTLSKPAASARTAEQKHSPLDGEA